MKKINIQAVVWKEGKYYVSQCLNVDVSSFGSTEKKALVHLQEAVELYLADNKSLKPTNILKPSIISIQLSYA